ncbi:MucR family transcriptional regulator [Mesorhizobium sp. M1E.F.Ca.ET.041.01.1.1]|uniref:MucR family transcriptional regulator n=1 Tax=Mesorhizobium sp. M1E.F.Ca.ET.041.01.1.1 TaxID=2496759 RepID=UPI000FCA8324|nr:MucR family transcriptional regulator [Mesorhizobium sp. M1E.F.Ca.ET.041.01.1.1]RUW18107.1 transcriptional regulator [Mesorhizobium sp. M1E.F.Ca.ET.041.01.1.1]RWD92532.1 MAG: transcriptional regulator [Mesorhizobium sp.]
MNEQSEVQNVDLIGLTADIVSAYVGNNPLPVSGLPELIASIHASLSGIEHPIAAVQPKLAPAVNPKRSVFPDYIICLEDGKKFKSLKRHLDVHYGLTPDEYREKWGLKSDYPMVAPNYAAQRSTLAKASGLGRKPAAKPSNSRSAKRRV